MRNIVEAHKRIRLSLLIKDFLHIFAVNVPNNHVCNTHYRWQGTKSGNNAWSEDRVFIEESHPNLIKIEKEVKIDSPDVLVAHNPNFHGILHEISILCKRAITQNMGYFGAKVVLVPGVAFWKISIVAAGTVVVKVVTPGIILADVPVEPTSTVEESLNQFDDLDALRKKRNQVKSCISMENNKEN